MPTFELEINGRRFEMEAPSADVAAAYARRVGSAVAGTAPGVQAAFGGGVPLDTNRTAPPDAGPAPQSDLSYRLGRAGQLADNTVRSIARGVPVFGGLADRADPRPEQDAQFAAEHPVMSRALPVGGAVAATVLGMRAAPAVFGLTQATLPGRILAGGAGGGAIGTADAAARGTNVVAGGLTGAATGAAAPVIGHVAGKLFGTAAAQRAAPSLQELEQQAHALYRAADDAGVVVAQPALERLAMGIDDAAKEAGYNFRLHPGIKDALDEAYDQAARGTMTLRGLDQFRRVIASAGKDIRNADQGRISGDMVAMFDDFLHSLGPDDIVAGNRDAGVSLLRQARDTWRRLSKGEVIEQIIDQARMAPPTQSWTLALRTQFRTLAKNQRRMAQFSPEEREAIRRIVTGGPIEGALDIIGKISPRTLHGAIMGGAAGGAAGGLVGIGVAPLVGEAGRAISGGITRNNAAIASALARSGPAYGQTAARVGGLRGAQAARLAQALLMPTVPRLAALLSPTNEERPARR